MTISIGIGVTTIVVLVLLEGFFSGSEIALVSADRVTIRAQRETGGRSIRLLVRFLEEPERILTTTLIGTNACTVTSTTVFGLLLLQHGPRLEHTEVLTVLLLSPVILLFGELLPKSIFRRYSTQLAPLVIHPLTWLSALLFPLVAIVRWLSTLLISRTGAQDPGRMVVTRDELRLLLEQEGSEEGNEEIEQEERRMIRRIIDFPEVAAKEVMKPLIDVTAVEESSTLDEAAALLMETGHSRLPIYRERIDDIVGVLHAMDVLHAIRSEQLVTRLSRPVTYVPPTQKVEVLFEELQEQRHGIAIVVDEWGGAEGMITVEDILEEIVGEIEDEHDDPSQEIRQRGPNEYLLSARMEVDRLNEELDIEVPEGDYETVAGFLLERFGRIPEPGDSTSISRATLTVVSATERVIEEVRVILQPRDQSEVEINDED